MRTQDGSNSARHWLVGNVPGKVLRTGFRNENTTAGVTILQPYHGPHPPAPGTPGRTDYVHVYGQFVVRALPSEPSTQLTSRLRLQFKQPTPKLSFAPMSADRHDWDYAAFFAKYKLGSKVASNYLLCSS